MRVELFIKLIKSLQKNMYIPALTRLSFFTENNKLGTRFKSMQRKFCSFYLDKKVPNAKFGYGRFFLNKKLNQFNINNTYK